MKGSLWQIWVFGLIAAFIAVMAFYVFTPFFEQMTTSAAANINFTQSINDSTTDTIDTMKTYWTYWPIAMLGMVMLLFFIVASDDEQKIRS